MAQARGTSGKNEDKTSKKVQNLNVKEEKKKKSGSSSGSSSSNAQPSKPSTPSQPSTSGRNLGDRGYDSTTSYTKKEIEQNNRATNAAVVRQNIGNANMLSRLMGSDASNLLQQTNTAAVFNAVVNRSSDSEKTSVVNVFNRAGVINKAADVLPSEVLRKIQENSDNGTLSNAFAKQVLASAKSLAEKRPDVYTARKKQEFEMMLTEFVADESKPKPVTYATASDFLNMQKKGYEAIYVEDGNAKFSSDKGVYTIGRNRLSGLPVGVKVILVDRDGNFKYIANTSRRAEVVESLYATQLAQCGDISNKMSGIISKKEAMEQQLDGLDKLVKKYEEIAVRTRNKIDIANYERALDARYSLYSKYIAEDFNTQLKAYGQQYAEVFTKYEDAKNMYTRWTTEDEQAYQDIKEQLDTYKENALVTTASGRQKILRIDNAEYAKLLSQYVQLAERREKYGDDPVFANADTIAYFKSLEESMGKAVDEYNVWGSVTLDPNKELSLGTAIREAWMTGMEARYSGLGYAITDKMQGTNKFDELMEQQVKVGNEFGETVLNAATNPYKVGSVAYSEYNKAYDAYQKAMKEAKTSKDRASATAVFDDEVKYINKQFAAIALSNLGNNMDVFDMYSVQREYVAYMMAKHPELYADDPKFKMMREAYKEVYGTDFRGSVDALRMAFTALQIERGKFDDSVYLDGSDLRHVTDTASFKHGEHYGFLASLAVGYCSDISNWMMIPKAAASTAARAGADGLVEVASDALVRTLVNNDIAESTARELVSSSNVQKQLLEAAQQAVNQSMKTGGDDLLEAFVKIERSTFNDIAGKSLDDVLSTLDDIDVKKFFYDATNALNELAPDAIERSLLLSKGTVIANTLNSVDDAIQDFQKLMFQITCPAAGAVVALHKGIKWAKSLASAGDISPEIVQAITTTGKQAMARISDMQFDDILDSANINKVTKAVQNEFYIAAMSNYSKFEGKAFDDVLGMFKDYESSVMRSTVNSYTNMVISDLSNRLSEGGLEALERFAKEYDYNSFDEMYKVINENLSQLKEYSPDSEAIVKAFNGDYARSIVNAKLDNIKLCVENVNTHVKSIQEILGVSDVATLSETNVLMNAELPQGVAGLLYDKINEFSATVNPDFVVDASSGFTAQEFLDDVINAKQTLENVMLGHTDVNSLNAANEAVLKYTDDINNVYLKNLKDFKDNALFDGLGKTNYLDRIQDNLVVANHAGSNELYESVCSAVVEKFKDKGITEADVRKFLIDSSVANKLSLEDQQVLMSLMPNKGYNVISQCADKSAVELVNGLTDCNSQLYRTLQLVSDSLKETVGDVADEVIGVNNIIQNACAMEASRKIIDTLQSEGLIDSAHFIAFVDSLSGNAAKVNNIIQSNPPDVAVEKIFSILNRDVAINMARHNDTYDNLWNVVVGDSVLHLNTVDVAANVEGIDKAIDAYKDVFKEDPNCIDICFSINRTTDGASPKDIAFYVRGSGEAPFTLHRDFPFDIHDDEFASHYYGRTAAHACEDYAALGDLDTVDLREYETKLKEFITQQHERALAENKTIRFVGFNSSDGLTGNNAYLSRVLRSCDINISTANSIDLADVIRFPKGEYIFTGDAASSIKRSISAAVDLARSRSITLGVAPTIAYNSRTTCADLLYKYTSKFNMTGALGEHISYISNAAKDVVSDLKREMYNRVGNVINMYVDIDALNKAIFDAGFSTESVRKDVMAAITSASDALGLHKIIEGRLVDGWFDVSKLKTKAEFLDAADSVYTMAQRMNQIHNDIKHAELITEEHVDSLLNIRKQLLKEIPHNSIAYTAARALKTEGLSPAELYAANRWLLERIKDTTDFDTYSELLAKLFIDDSEMASYLSDVGYRFMTTRIIDTSDDFLDVFRVKYLDTSELGVKYARQMFELQGNNQIVQSLKDYQFIQEGLYRADDLHGTQDKLRMVQSAAVFKPIIELDSGFREVYDTAYAKAAHELREAGYHKNFIRHEASGRAYDAWVEAKRAYRDSVLKDSVQSVIDLDKDALNAHIVRNCLGGMIIDTTYKALEGVDLAVLLKKWKEYGFHIDTVKISSDTVSNRTVIRVISPDVIGGDTDAIFKKFNHAYVEFHNKSSAFGAGIRHNSFGASDWTLVNADHVDSFRKLFFNDMPDSVLDIGGRFRDWANETYCCNMWADSDIKRLVNPYYSDDIVKTIAQSTHQVRNNISALHDLGTIMNNPYMRTANILSASVFNSGMSYAEYVQAAIKQIKDQEHRICKIVQKGKKFKIIDYTSRINADNFDDIIHNTIMIDDAMYDTLSDWNKATSMAIKMQHNATELSAVYKTYKDTIRSATVSMYLFGNVATGMRNMVDSATKAVNEILQNNESMVSFIKNYLGATKDKAEYCDLYRKIESELGTVNRETIAEFFQGNREALEKFNLLYGYENTSGGDNLVSYTTKQLREDASKYITEAAGLDADIATDISKIFDSVYASPRYRGLTKAQLANHMTAIHDTCMKHMKRLLDDNAITQEQYDLLSQAFYGYHPVVETWGDKLCKFPILKHNQAVFQNAETRARLGLYKTFIEGGASESEAMRHVTATQFDYAGIGHTEDFLPFTQYKLYNAVYWFEHAGGRAVATAWRQSQANGDMTMTTQEIAEMCSKYRQRQYYLYDQGADSDYDQFVQEQLNITGHILLDGIDSYLGLPRELQAGNIDLNGTHYVKLGNSFVEETSLVLSCAVGAFMFSQRSRAINTKNSAWQNIRAGYEALKCTPLYDSFYSPWKAWIDLAMYAGDREEEARQANNRPHVWNSAVIWNYAHDYIANKNTHSLAVAGIPVLGAIISNIIGRGKAFDLNVGEMMALFTDPDAQQDTATFINDVLLNVVGGVFPSLWGTQTEPFKMKKYDYYYNLGAKYLKYDPATYFDLNGRLQKEGFSEEEAAQILSAFYADKGTEAGKYLSKAQYLQLAQELLSRGYTQEEVVNLLKQHNISLEDKRFLGMYAALPAFLKYDADLRNEVIAYYKAMGMSTEEAWAMLIMHPATMIDGVAVELSPSAVARLNKQQNDLYNAMRKQTYWTDEDWDAFQAQLRELGFYYPKGEQKRVREYFMSAGYSFEEAQKMILDGFMLDKNGNLVDVQGQARRRVFSYNTLQGAEWDAYWNTVPDYTKYEKGAFGRTMKALKKMGYTDEQARAWIQMGIYVTPEGIMINVTGMERPVLGYKNFNAYYQTLPDYMKYEKGAFKRTYAALKQLGFDYDTSLMLIQQGAYLMDATLVQNTMRTLGARRNRDGSAVVVTNLSTLLQRYGGQPIVGADGKTYMLVDCSGLQRARKTYSYSRRSGGGRRGGGRSWSNYKKQWNTYSRPFKYTTRKPFVIEGNVSTYSGFTNYRGSTKLSKPYTTNGYVSTYSTQNFLNGASYGMRKVYKVDMRQFKSGAMSTKKAYPAAYRNIAVAYRRNMYKDLYAKYGASRMMMRANAPGYSNASIVRLRRNEIYNRERYAERRDQISRLKVKKKAGS